MSRASSYYKGEPREETRQEYANFGVQSFQRYWTTAGKPRTFAQLLAAFRSYGKLYDQGYRLRDHQAGAA